MLTWPLAMLVESSLVNVTSNLNNVLLSSAQDITLNANIAATALNVGVIAGRSVIQNANITAGQDILVRALGVT